jgi:hypothetical protein
MTIGYFAAGQCFDTAQEANDWYFSSKLPLIVASGTDKIVTQYLQINGLWYHINDKITNANIILRQWTHLADYPSVPFCLSPAEQSFDAETLGFFLLGLLGLSLCIYQLKRALR